MTSVNILRGGKIKADNTAPPLRLRCLTEGGDPYNLTGFTVTLKLRRTEADTNKVDSTVTLDQPEVGVVEYSWQTGDTDTTGVFEGELVANDGAGTVVSFPNHGNFTVHIQESL